MASEKFWNVNSINLIKLLITIEKSDLINKDVTQHSLNENRHHMCECVGEEQIQITNRKGRKKGK